MHNTVSTGGNGNLPQPPIEDDGQPFGCPFPFVIELDLIEQVCTLREFYREEYMGKYADALVTLCNTIECIILWQNRRKWHSETNTVLFHPLRIMADTGALLFLKQDGVIHAVESPSFTQRGKLEELVMLMNSDWLTHELWLFAAFTP